MRALHRSDPGPHAPAVGRIASTTCGHTMTPANTIVTVVALLAAGCAGGQRLNRYPPALGPAGVSISVGLDKHRVGGELLAVEDSTLLLITASRDAVSLVRIPERAIQDVRAVDGITRSWTAELRERWRLLARYPAGVTRELERRLLVAYEADSVRWVDS